MREEEYRQLDFCIALQNKLKERIGADLFKDRTSYFQKS